VSGIFINNDNISAFPMKKQKPNTCVSCGKGLLEKGSTTFICPMCDYVIGRCSSCREQSV